MSRSYFLIAVLIYLFGIVDCQTSNETFPKVYQTFMNIVTVLKNFGDNNSLKHLGDLVPKIAVIGVQSAGGEAICLLDTCYLLPSYINFAYNSHSSSLL